MDDLSRSEYPAMLANLHPGQAVQAFSDRVKRINKINQEIADWLQERRKVEELYIAGLRKLLLFRAPNASSELGVFQAPWDRILHSTHTIATSHNIYVQRVEKDVEQALRGFQNTREMQNIMTINQNLHSMAKELDDAHEKSDRLTRKGARANAQKVDMAVTRLEAASQQWDSQAPFIFETLQALDEQRVNHVRDVLTQLETHEVDQCARTQTAAEEVLNAMLEINTAQEIQEFAQRTVAGKPRIERQSRQSSIAGNSAGGGGGGGGGGAGGGGPAAPPSVSGHEDNASEHSGNLRPHEESRLRSRIGTMLGRRRQSVHAGFGPLAAPKPPFTRNVASSHGRVASPRASFGNLGDSHNRLASLQESPTAIEHAHRGRENAAPPHEGTNGLGNGGGSPRDAAGTRLRSSSILNGTAEEIFDTVPPPVPPLPSSPSGPSASTSGFPGSTHQAKLEPIKDEEGYTIVAASGNDPISEAQRAAGVVGPGGAMGDDDAADQLFKLNIKNEPIAEEDQDAKDAALSNVANTLTQMAMPTRKAGTVRGRRDVRNTIYAPSMPIPGVTSALPASLSRELTPDAPFPPSPSLPAGIAATNRPTPSTTFASESSHLSDTQSIRSGTSLGAASSYSAVTRLRHADLHGTGLHASIIETVSATFEDNAIKTVKISGELAFAHNPDPAWPSQPDHETIRLNNFPNLAAIGPNRLLVSNNSAPDEFSLDMLQIPSTSPSPCFTYRVHSDDESGVSLAPRTCPLAIHMTWKPQGDKLGLLLQYRRNPDFIPAGDGADPIVLHNVVLVTTYGGPRPASGVQTKPSGTHVKDKHLVYWRLGDVSLSGSEWAKIVCRIVGDQNAEPLPGQVEARWEWQVPAGADAVAADSAAIGSGISISRLATPAADTKGKGRDREPSEDESVEEEDPFADTTAERPATWVDVPLVRRLVSGKYEAR